MLGDIDRQQSARQWLALRATVVPALPAIRGWRLTCDPLSNRSRPTGAIDL